MATTETDETIVRERTAETTGKQDRNTITAVMTAILNQILQGVTKNQVVQRMTREAMLIKKKARRMLLKMNIRKKTSMRMLWLL